MECCDEKLTLFLREIWKIFGKYSAAELVEMSHKHDPWKNNYKEGVPNIKIPRKDIEAFYKILFKVENG